jgi:hypothetical protein
MERRPFEGVEAAYRADRPILVRGRMTVRQELARTAEARRLISDSTNRTRALEALGPLRRAASVFN